MEAGYKIRRQRVDEICRKFGEILKRDEKRFDQNLMIDEVHKLAYCRHGKVRLSKKNLSRKRCRLPPYLSSISKKSNLSPYTKLIDVH